MDLCNTGGRMAGSCTAAYVSDHFLRSQIYIRLSCGRSIFLKRFVDGLIVDGKDAEVEEGTKLIRWCALPLCDDLRGS